MKRKSLLKHIYIILIPGIKFTERYKFSINFRPYQIIKHIAVPFVSLLFLILKV